MFSHIYITFNTLLLKGIDEFDTDAKNLRRYVTNTFLYVVLHVFDMLYDITPNEIPCLFSPLKTRFGNPYW